MLKYESSNTNISSRVVPYFVLDTSGSHDVSWVCEFVEGKPRPLGCLHRHEIACCSKIELHVHSCWVQRVVSTHRKASSCREQGRMFWLSWLNVDTSKCRMFRGFAAGGGVQLFSRTFTTRS